MVASVASIGSKFGSKLDSESDSTRPHPGSIYIPKHVMAIFYHVGNRTMLFDDPYGLL